MRTARVFLLLASLISLVSVAAYADADSDLHAARKAIQQKNYEKALSLLRPLVDAHDRAAECLYGDMYEFGYGVQKDQEEALKWYKLAARAPHEQQYSIRIMEFGAPPANKGQQKQYVEAVTEAAENGDQESQRILGTLYFKGIGVKQDFGQAFAWYEKSAAHGNPAALNDLGFMYQHGAFVKQDFKKAAELYEKAADLGNFAAQGNLGFLYEKGLGVPCDYEKAVKLFTTAEHHGNWDAASNLGYMYQKGYGVPVDYNHAVRLYAKAAAHGVAAAKYNLGFMYEYGLGVKRQVNKAGTLYRLAADMGYPAGENNLGFMYDYGRDVPSDYKVALKWYKEQAERRADMFRLVPNFDIYD